MSDSLLDIKSTSNDQLLPTNTDGISTGKCHWNSIDWPRAYKLVKNLRFRIFKATKRGDVKSVSRLQRLVIRSYENRLLAVRQISQINVGKKTPGLDKFLVNTPTERGELVDLLGKTSMSTWKPSPTKRIYIPKATGKTLRPLGIPSIIDRCLQYIVKNALEPEWEAKFEGSSYGFRPGRSCHDALHRIYNNCAHTRAQKVWVVDANISGCFDNISHEYILKALGNFPEKGILSRWLKSGYVDNNVFHHTPLGTSQGGVISPLLANIALHGMHEPLGIKISLRGETLGEKGLVRYADDFVVFCKSEAAAKESYVTLDKWLSIRGLRLSKQKTKITHIDQGFDFLGTTIRRFHISDVKSRLLIKPSKKSILKCRLKLKRLWTEGQGNPVNLTIRRLNAFIRGWANYFRPYVSKEVFSSLDNYMFTQAVRFSRRTHPLKSWKWRKKQYFGKFHFARKDNWVFGEKKTGHFVLRFSWFPIQRHTMVKNEYSPFDPELSEYWAKRESNRASWEFTQKKDMKIAAKQKHVCPVCKESLYTGEELHRHHKVPLKDGGLDILSNIIFLHILCHQQIHRTSKLLPREP
jgi:RNA-directed DNA polymerase